MEPTIRFSDKEILLAHGSGGKASRRLIEGLIVPILSSPELERLNDAATVKVGSDDVVVTTDSFVVSPRVFSGGSIGELAVNGTLNDLAVSGAEPIAITLAMILEAGLSTQDLTHELLAIAKSARDAGIEIVTGDTKVVEHGKADGIFITTTGIGRMHQNAQLSVERARPGDRVLLSGPIGDHGITVLLARGEIDLQADELVSDTRSVWPFINTLLDTFGAEVKWIRDPTRGGLATTLNEFATAAELQVLIDEENVVINPPVRGACEVLGLDPFHIANEGQFVAIISDKVAAHAESLLKSMPGGHNARLIGSVTEGSVPIVLCKTAYGVTRVLDMLSGDPLPRIC